MTKYETISIPADVKKILRNAKGEREWEEFLLNLYPSLEIEGQASIRRASTIANKRRSETNARIQQRIQRQVLTQMNLFDTEIIIELLRVKNIRKAASE